jgi:TolB-like protein/tetratricopeptide (TPR) repeat protein
MRTQRGTGTASGAGQLQVTSVEAVVPDHVERIFHSPHFDGSTRSREILRFIVDETLSGHGENLGQAAIAKAVFHREANFDAILDPIVRVQMGRLRRSLERYYLLSGDAESIRIEIPKGTYAPTFMSASAKHAIRPSEVSDVEMKSVTLAEVVPDWPTLAIQFFDTYANRSADEVTEHLEDQLTMELNRYGGVHVARHRDLDRLNFKQHGSVRFELRGSLRNTAKGYVVGARLVDRSTGEQLWSDEYLTRLNASGSRNTDDIVRAIAARVGAEHGVIMRLLARERCSRKDMTGAFTSILRCNHFFLTRQVSDLLPTMTALEDLTAREPEVSVAWTYLARLYTANYSFELSDVHTPIEKAISCAYQGVALDPTSIRGRCALAKALLIKGELASAQEEIEQALQLNPDSLAYLEMAGWLMALAGNWERGMKLMRGAVERNPFCSPCVKHGLWADHMRRGEFDKAYVAALENSGLMFFWRNLMSASCLGHLGRLGEADASAMELLHAKPDFPQHGRTLIGYFIKSNELCQRIVEGLGKAGIVLR